jgi:hypothetical protein
MRTTTSLSKQAASSRYELQSLRANSSSSVNIVNIIPVC